MPRYYTELTIDEPMVELSEEEAAATPVHTVEISDPGGPLHYRVMLRGAISHVAYRGQTPDANIAAFHRARYAGIPYRIITDAAYTPTTRTHRIWYYDKDGKPTHAADYERHPSEQRWMERYYRPDGSYRGSIERMYDDEGEVIEVIQRDAEGTIISHE